MSVLGGASKRQCYIHYSFIHVSRSDNSLDFLMVPGSLRMSKWWDRILATNLERASQRERTISWENVVPDSDKQDINNPLILGSLAGNGAAHKAVGGRAGVSIRREMSEKENGSRTEGIEGDTQVSHATF